MYYIEKDNKIVLKDNNLQTITFSRDNAYPQFKELPILETDKNIIEFEGKFYFEDDEEYIEKHDKAERERINKLSLTKREVFLALYKSKSITPEMVRGSITDTEALIEFDYASEYFRGNPLIDRIGEMLGYSTNDLDYLFINKELPNNKESEK
jgi:hypothetical protein